MNKTVLVGATVGACGAVLLASCAASATMAGYMKGRWECTSPSSEGSATVDVGDGTFTISAGDQTGSGTWDTAFGDLTVKITHWPSPGIAGGVLASFPAKDAPQGTFTSPWTPSFSDGESAAAAPLAVSIDGNKVRLVYKATDGTQTTTTCAKR